MLKRGMTRQLWWLATGTYSLLMLYLAVMHTDGVSVSITYLDKVVHFFEFVLFGWLLTHAEFSRNAQLNVIPLWGVCFAYAVLLEGFQAFVPWRSVEVADLAMNMLGATGGLLLTLRLSMPIGVCTDRSHGKF